MPKFKRYDMKEPPRRFKWYLKPVADLICAPAIRKYRPRVTCRGGIEAMDGPYLLLCNHNAFLDISVAYSLLRKKHPNFVVAIDGFIGREQLLRNIGCICKRKFTTDPGLIRKLKTVLDRGDIPVIYPEARYSLCGTTAVLPSSLGKMIKLFRVPVGTLICHGHHVNSPFWDTSHERGIPYDEAEFSLLLTKEETETLSADEINDRILEAFQYDDFAWQRDNSIRITDPSRADGLDKVLYQCPACGKEYRMTSSGAVLSCTACGKAWTMDEMGQLHADKGETEFPHIPDWYEWQRENVRREVTAGTYSTGVLPVNVKSLPNARKFIDLGEGELVHDGNGFRVTLKHPPEDDTKEIVLKVPETYSVHIEYRDLFKNGDCVDLNTPDDTWYVYPHDCDFAVTKMALAAEELYQEDRRRKGKPCKKGFA